MSVPAVDGVPSTWGTKLLYAGTRVVSAPLLTLGFSLRTQPAKTRIPAGPLLIIANHQSFLDPPLVGLAFERPLVYLARKTLFENPFFGGLIRGLNAVPIDQDGIGKDGLRAILEQLSLGKAVLVFPEGTRTPDGRVQPLRPGIHLLIKRTTAPIVPVGIAGAYDAWPSWRKYPIPSPLFLPPTPRTIGVAVGAPLDPRTFAAMPRDDAMTALGGELDRMRGVADRFRRT